MFAPSPLQLCASLIAQVALRPVPSRKKQYIYELHIRLISDRFVNNWAHERTAKKLVSILSS